MEAGVCRQHYSMNNHLIFHCIILEDPSQFNSVFPNSPAQIELTKVYRIGCFVKDTSKGSKELLKSRNVDNPTS